jgi:hypothetical protein
MFRGEPVIETVFPALAEAIEILAELISARSGRRGEGDRWANQGVVNHDTCFDRCGSAARFL